MRAVTHALGAGLAPAQFAGTPWAEAAASAAAHAPYLNRLFTRRPDLCIDLDAAWADRVVARAVADANAIAASPLEIGESMGRLRRAKDAVHLATALADLARVWPLQRVTGAITDFAETALRAAVSVGAAESARRGDFVARDTLHAHGPAPGVAFVAMGKMGAGELNYSSDIDFSVFFDIERLTAAGAREPRVAAVRLVAPIVRVLEEITAEGYVFRTDLRLRPDPGSTPVAVSTAMAEHYYQTLGQNWERCAFIKARAAAGDRPCGEDFLASLQPFIWRRHLDFAAVEDVHSIKRQILSAHKSAELGDPAFDVKLGRGGIRDIELFVQTQQLILGGRNKKLRVSGTLAALDALAEAGVIVAPVREALSEAYVFFREVEHRIQMLEDAQTHRLPGDPETRARVAALSGFDSLAAFDEALIARRRIVSEIDHQLFGRGESLADPMGSLIFTGVEDHPDTLATIARLGFKDPAFVSQTIRGWHHGRIRAMRAERARELLTRLTPRLLRALSEAGDPDHAFARFNSFFSGLVAGVQVLSLLDARPALLALLARLFTVAPRLSETLSRRPALLDGLIEPRFASPLSQDQPGTRLRDLAERVADAEGFEAKLNAARRYQRDEAFRIDAQVLEGVADAAMAGAAQADLAEACVELMLGLALAEVAKTHGEAPRRCAVLAFGKLGGRELAQGSDLDLMLVYDAEAGSGASDYFARVTQRLISALSAPTEEGLLYEVDTKLRPSGSKGPVAVRLSSLERYYEEDAWTWEFLALTRLRGVAGDQDLCRRVEAIARAALTKPRDAAKVLAEAADMRGRIERERTARTIWDFKLAPGGLVDIEFIAQALQLAHAQSCPQLLSPNTGDALMRLQQADLLTPADGERLYEAWRLWSDLVHVIRVCVPGEFDPAEAPEPLRRRLAGCAGEADFEALDVRVRALQAAVRHDFIRLIGPLGDGAGPLNRS